MKKCILCKSDQLVYYGDDVFGEVFCRDCYNQHSCLHCNRMNIMIAFDRNNNVIHINIKPFHGTSVSHGSILLPLFDVGYKFKLYCKECWDTQEMYQEDDDNSVEPDEDDMESYYSDNEDNEEDEQNNNLNSYYTGKGKYDLY